MKLSCSHRPTGKIFFVLAILGCFFSGCMQSGENISTNRVRDFDSDWRFIKDSIVGAEQATYEDSAWRVIDLPHDWSIEDLPAGQIPGETIGPFSKKSEGANDGNSTGHVVGGTGWYRKTFTLPEADKGKNIFIDFDGVYRNSEVFINGQSLGIRPNLILQSFANRQVKKM